MAAPETWQTATAAIQPNRASAFRSACLEALRRSGLFDAGHYLQSRGTLPTGVDPLEDYHDRGWALGCWPNPYFDPKWYAAQNPDVQAGGGDPLLHYVSYGEQEGRRPVPWFDPAWYRAHHAVEPSTHCLRHFLEHRCGGQVSPIAEFDGIWYLATYPDVAAAGMDPFEHYRLQGFREMRSPSPGFDPRFYKHRYLAELPEENPLLHYLRHRGEPGIHMRLPAGETTIAREMRFFAAAGPLFEPVRPLAPGTALSAMVLAYYLPQYHAIPENNAWWGEGFTEWTNVARALPRFAGHYQPRIPRDLGHYTLDDPATMHRQIALATGAGIGGFVFYFYWFNGRRLLEQPVERFLADPVMAMPFCLMWANENWTRRWDGSENEVLIAQLYDPADEAALIAEFARHFADPRYIRLQGRAVLMIYRPRLIPDARATLGRWRTLFLECHGEAPILVMAQSFNDADPREFGLDGATEFPPHKLVNAVPRIDAGLDVLDQDFTAQVYEYAAVAAVAEAMPAPDYPLIRAVVPGWDNDARRQGHGLVVHQATPSRYQQWLRRMILQARARPFFGAAIVCVNAWNEWAEGAYLEPDQHFGGAFLNATSRANAGIEQAGAHSKLLLVGHDAFAAGAQMLLLKLGRQLSAVHGVCVAFVLCGEGALAAQYRELAPLTIVDGPEALQKAAARLHEQGYRHALVNSAASAWCCQVLAAHDIAPILMVHEMAGLLTERGLAPALDEAATVAAAFVYPAEVVRASVAPLLAGPAPRSLILPQGLYSTTGAAPGQAASVRRRLGLKRQDVLAVGVGYADRRKGFDLFLNVFRLASAGCPGLHMAWLGDIEAGLLALLAPEIEAARATGRFHLPGFCTDTTPFLAAAQLFLLTSREDPYPSAALEAIGAGLPVLAFEGSGGIAALVQQRGLGWIVKMADCGAMADVVIARQATRRLGARKIAAVRTTHDFPAYTAALLHEIWPGEPRISVIVPCYRQETTIGRRLASIFAQTCPLHELVLRDDASDDASVAEATRTAAAAGRALAIIVADRNTGSPFGCWRDAVARATGELVWIAEADDASEPEFLDRAAQALQDPDMLFAFSHSRPIADDGSPRAEVYAASYAEIAGPAALSQDAVFDAAEFAEKYLSERNILFNVSAVLWRRTALTAALDRLGDDLQEWRIAGDWRLYLEVLAGSAGRIAFIAKPLNLHRLHTRSATSRMPTQSHLDEIRRMHLIINERLGSNPARAQLQAGFVRQAATWLGHRIDTVGLHVDQEARL